MLDDSIYKLYKKVKRDSTVATERKVGEVIRELEKKDLIPSSLGEN